MLPKSRSRLDTLPGVVLRMIFKNVGEDCGTHEDLFLMKKDGQEHKLSTFETLQGLQDDALSSAAVRQVAFEELHRKKLFEMALPTDPNYDRSMVHFVASTTVLSSVCPHNFASEPRHKLGHFVRELTLGVADMSCNGDSDGIEDTAEVSRSTAWSDKATCILILLAAVPLLQRLEPSVDGVGLIQPEASLSLSGLSRLCLRRLKCIKLAGNPYSDSSRVLDVDNALFHAAPSLAELHLEGYNTIVSSKSKPESEPVSSLENLCPRSRPRLAHLTTIHIDGYCLLTATSLQNLLGAVGSQLTSFSVPLARQTCRPSFSTSHKQLSPSLLPSPSGQLPYLSLATLHDVLVALQPWQATSLTHLDVCRTVDYSDPPSNRSRNRPSLEIQHTDTDDDDGDEDRSATSRFGTSSTLLLKNFVALRHFTISIDLLDWRAPDKVDDDSDDENKTTRAAAEHIVACLPPNLESLHVTHALHDTSVHDTTSCVDGSPQYTTLSRFWLQRECLARSLLAAIRNGRFPHLKEIRILPHPIHLQNIDSTECVLGGRKIKLSALFSELLVGAAPDDGLIYTADNISRLLKEPTGGS